ncbi:hypothetical protein EV361DRAFT_798215 [Lentinula raphanica]|uniref:ABC transporter domain-containing protein n=1 Tax=Lentinula raphanica TaxID=153919 RepID=A0AA38U9Q3_9AGAR|nr:hypothetical protein F5878DRAFT_543828 [Lentinula raphanica]KAJ3972360.1 hypothetical protein EV361DRAFT_798215 [Lentinula raphanica]
MLPAFTCGQYGDCDPYDGQCKCPPGWSGIDCLTPQCGSLADDQRMPREDGTQCECKDGWGGINCNVCKTDQACKGFPLYGIPDSEQDGSEAQNMTCYTGGETVFQNHQMCDVTNRKILDQVGDNRPVQVTFSCDKNDATCSFQFWVDEIESFYCGLDECSSEITPGYDFNTTSYKCEKLKCKCVPGRFICGQDGSVDISDFLTEEIKGPASFSCTSGDPNSGSSFAGDSSPNNCKFSEAAMNQLINDVFGDPYITLTCEGGECLHYSQVPGYVRPPKPDNTTWVALNAVGACLFVVLVALFLWYVGRTGSGGDYGNGGIKLPESEENESAQLMAEHVPASMHFDDLSYVLNSKVILSGISGAVKPGQVMAVMGASGAGKSTLLDILARKSKRGIVGGEILINGRIVNDAEFRAVTGYVDQEDTLMSTLTVYETVLYSALLRLPREMSEEAKKFRTLETLNELGILGIKDMRIGNSGHRSISGGEKRRVSIACELVTSPSILFLDEPTSGLDAFNAYNVIESLVSLAKNYHRTVIFTIHQPRSNIVTLFDQLLVLAMGRVVYSGEFGRCGEYFDSIGKPCPPGFNIADYLIDLTVQSSIETRSPSPTLESNSPEEDTATGETTVDAGPTDDTELQLQTRARPSSVMSNSSVSGAYNSIKRKTSQLFEVVSGSGSSLSGNGSNNSHHQMAPKLKYLVDEYKRSDVAKDIRDDREVVRNGAVAETENMNGNHENVYGGQLPDVAAETTLLRGRKRASWGTQFRILSGRAFKNLYRDPALLMAHYLSAVLLALFCGVFYHNITNDIAGFQNRLGFFFFTLALFGFSCLSSLGLFANERILFMRERSNGYYSSFTYFSSKILFDILPLRLVPPLMFGGIVYGLIGLVPTVGTFWKFILALVLFNLTTASVVLWLSIAFESVSVASLVGTLIMLYNLLFTGLLINRETVTKALQFLHTISFFHAAFEALAVNELRYLSLKEHKYGVELDVPAATILSTFGLRAQSYWWPNIALLGIFFGIFTVGSFLTLHFFVKEKR